MQLLTPRNLMAGGHTRRDIDQLLAAGELRRVRHGVYTSDPVTDLTREHLLQVMAALPGLPADGVFSHESAAVLHGLPLKPGKVGPVRVTRAARVDRGGGQRTKAVRVTRAHVTDAEIEQLQVGQAQVPVTNQIRTVIDLARQSVRWGVVAADHALRHGVSRHVLERALADHAGRHGVARARAAVQFADALAESPAESLSRIELDRAGIPAATLQYELRTAGGRFVARGDFGWPEFRVLGECDGMAKYADPAQGSVADALRREKDREAAIRDLGWWVVRWTYADIAAGMSRRVASALAAHGWDGRRRRSDLP